MVARSLRFEMRPRSRFGLLFVLAHASGYDRMRISALPQIYRNVRRWTEILSVLSKYGLADWLSQTNIEFAKDQLTARDGEALARLTREGKGS